MPPSLHASMPPCLTNPCHHLPLPYIHPPLMPLSSACPSPSLPLHCLHVTSTTPPSIPLPSHSALPLPFPHHLGVGRKGRWATLEGRSEWGYTCEDMGGGNLRGHIRWRGREGVHKGYGGRGGKEPGKRWGGEERKGVTSGVHVS